MPARTDQVDDPKLASELVVMRRGQAYFARKLMELRDEDFDDASLLPDWSRRQVIAHVGFNARALARLVTWARTGIETPMYDSPEQRAAEISFGATLPSEALRNLVAHSAIHLNVEWRDLPADAWSAQVRTAQGRLVPASETVWMRTREVWLHAVDLKNGGRFEDFPPELIDRLLVDLVTVWRRKRAPQDPDLALAPTDRDQVYRILADEAGSEVTTVRGSAAQLLEWGTGRGGTAVSTNGGELPHPPTWL